jgi:hypothetical protein
MTQTNRYLEQSAMAHAAMAVIDRNLKDLSAKARKAGLTVTRIQDSFNVEFPASMPVETQRQWLKRFTDLMSTGVQDGR